MDKKIICLKSVINSIKKADYVFFDKNNDLYTITDLYRALIIHENTMIENDLLKYFPHNKRDVFGYIPNDKGNLCRDLPNIEEIKFWVDKKKEEQRKDHKRGYKLFYYFKDGYCVNAEYLLDGIKSTNTMFGSTTKKITSVLSLIGNECIYFLCPIRSIEKYCGFKIVK